MHNEVQIGTTKLYRGDSLQVLRDLADQGVKADILITDPPYSSGGQFRGDRTMKTSDKYQQSQHRHLYSEFTGDNRDQRSFMYWSSLWMSEALRIVKPGGLCVIFTDWRQLPTTTDAIQCGGWVWRGLVVWDKTEATRPRLGAFRNQCEYMVWGSNGAMPNEGKVAPGVFRYSAQLEKKHHIAGKPVVLFEDLLQLTKPGDVILDPFMGSGTTGVAAVKNGRNFLGIELDPGYFEVSCERVRDSLKSPDLFREFQQPEQNGLSLEAEEPQEPDAGESAPSA